MKYFVLIILFFAALSFAQVGKYTHIVAGGFNKAGQHLANGFACWDTKNNRFGNLPRASFTGGGAQVSDIATAGKGFLVVGTFTQVNGINANGIAFFDGSKWCSFPHLQLYTYDVPNPSQVTNPIQYPNRRNQQAGYALAIGQIAGNANDFYVFGGRRGDNRPAFNQVGNVQTGVAGLVKLTFDGTGNFTVGAVGGYETRPGQFTGAPLNDGNGYPADFAPTGTAGRTKVKVVVQNSITSFYVHPSVGTAGHIQRWRTGTGSVDSQWIAVTQSTVVQQNFNVSQVSVAYNILAQGLDAGVARDFDHDGTNLFIAGQFDNSQNTTSNTNYINVACSPNANTNGITWQVAATWPNPNNFNQTATQVSPTVPTITNANLGAFRIAVESTGVYYVATAFVSVDTTATADRDLAFRPQYFIYKVSNNVPTLLGNQAAPVSPRFDVVGTGQPSFSRLSVYNGRLYVFGNFALYSWVNNQNNQWPRHYQRCISNAVLYDGTDFVDAYGGFATVGANYPLIAPNAQPGVDFVYVAGQTNFYDIFSAGSVVAYNRDTKRWANLAANRFTLRGTATGSTSIQGNNGAVIAVHFIRRQRDNVNDAVVVAGSFDWYGNQYLASVAFLRTSTGTYEQLGGGLFVEENDSTYEADQNLPIYRAGVVYDIEEIDGKFYAGGVFTKNTQGACLNNVASVSATNTGDVWAPLGAGCDGLVRDLIAKGDDLYVAGDFNSCAGVDGTRRIARFDTKKGTWWALQEGLEGSVYAMIWYRGNLLVGGSFGTGANAPAAYRSNTNGLWEWNGNRWAPLSARCGKDCDGATSFTSPFVSQTGGYFDPASRSVNDVRSLRTTGGNLYIHGSVPSGANGVLIQYDGNSFKQYGTASNGCFKQGCLASNFSEVIALFTRGNGLNQNYMQYNPDRQNWVDTYTGFDNQPVIVASATQVALSLFSLFLVILLAF